MKSYLRYIYCNLLSMKLNWANESISFYMWVYVFVYIQIYIDSIVSMRVCVYVCDCVHENLIMCERMFEVKYKGKLYKYTVLNVGIMYIV